VLDGYDRDQLNIPHDFIDLENQKYSNRDNEEKNEKTHLLSSQIFEPLPSTNQLIFESMNV
jgi:hypothetical protein